MSNQRFTREYECDGCGPMGESHRHALIVDFAYTSMTVAVERTFDKGEKDRHLYSWPEWLALREIANEERGTDPVP